MNRKRTDAERRELIMSSIKINYRTGCWQWTAFTERGGYGKFRFRGKKWMAHRVSFTLFKKEIPKGKLVLHSCDNPCCVNPSHLFLGTHQDNSNDQAKKNRQFRPQGEKHPQAVLTEKKVLLIRILLKKPNAVGGILAKRFNVSRDTISRIKLNKTWTHI